MTPHLLPFRLLGGLRWLDPDVIWEASGNRGSQAGEAGVRGGARQAGTSGEALRPGVLLPASSRRPVPSGRQDPVAPV